MYRQSQDLKFAVTDLAERECVRRERCRHRLHDASAYGCYPGFSQHRRDAGGYNGRKPWQTIVQLALPVKFTGAENVPPCRLHDVR